MHKIGSKTNKSDQEKPIEIQAGKQIAALAIIGSKLYVADTMGNDIYVFDTENDTQLAKIKSGNGPVSLATHGSMLFIASKWSKEILILDTTKNRFIGKPIFLSGHPNLIKIINNKIYVSYFIGEKSYVISYELAPLFLYYRS